MWLSRVKGMSKGTNSLASGPETHSSEAGCQVRERGFSALPLEDGHQAIPVVGPRPEPRWDLDLLVGSHHRRLGEKAIVVGDENPVRIPHIDRCHFLVGDVRNPHPRSGRDLLTNRLEVEIAVRYMESDDSAGRYLPPIHLEGFRRDQVHGD